jgi:hypothetical protein
MAVATAHIVTADADMGAPRITILTRGGVAVLDRIPLTPEATLANGEYFLRTYTPWRLIGEPTDVVPDRYRIWAVETGE